jgi:hypothetical protein
MKTSEPPDPAEEHERKLFAKARFQDLYELIKDHCDWVSINWYVDTHPEQEPGEPKPRVRPMADFMESMDAFLRELEKVAPGKPVLITELGFPPPDSKAKISEGMKTLLAHPNVKAAVFWTDGTDVQCQVRPDTPQAAALRKMIDEMPDKFHSDARSSEGGKPAPEADKNHSK